MEELVDPAVRGIHTVPDSLTARLDRESPDRPPGLKGFLYWWLESDYNDRRYIFDLFISTVIVVSIVLLVMDTSYGPPEQTPDWIALANLGCLVIFIVEYLCRFWVNTDFLADVLEADSWVQGLGEGIQNKIKWMIQPFSIIDLVAIIPVGSLRALRMFRFFRIARLLRLLKLGRYSAGFAGFVEEIRNRSFELIALGGVVAGIILIGAIAIFTVETPHMDGSLFNNFGDALWWATVTTTTVGYGDIYPKYFGGRIIATGLMLSSIGIVGALGGILTSAMMERIRKMREGRIARITFMNHIVFCGWTECARKVAESLNQTGLLDEKRLVVITDGEVPDEDHLLALEGDFSRPENLRTVNTGDSDFVVVFHQVSEGISRREADQKSVLTALQAEQFNPDREEPYTITEVLDKRQSALITGEEIKGEEALDKEEFDANLILNTIQYPGHTTEVFYTLSNVTDQWIQIRDVGEFYADEELPVTVEDFQRRCLDENRRLTFIGFEGPDTDSVRINPPNREPLAAGSRLYVVEPSPYESEEIIETTGEAALEFELDEEPFYHVQEDFVFLGYNECARRVIRKLQATRWVDNDRRIVVVSEKRPPDEPWIQHIRKDFSEARKIQDPEWWEDKKLAIIFHEEDGGTDDDKNLDIKAAVTAMQLPADVRVIVEIIEEDYAEVLRRDIQRDIELIYKERFDASIIANSIINDGKMTEVFREIGNLEGDRLKTYEFSHLAGESEASVRSLREKILTRDHLTFLGVMVRGQVDPILNPDPGITLEEGDIVYCLARE